MTVYSIINGLSLETISVFFLFHMDVLSHYQHANHIFASQYFKCTIISLDIIIIWYLFVFFLCVRKGPKSVHMYKKLPLCFDKKMFQMFQNWHIAVNIYKSFLYMIAKRVFYSTVTVQWFDRLVLYRVIEPVYCRLVGKLRWACVFTWHCRSMYNICF